MCSKCRQCKANLLKYITSCSHFFGSLKTFPYISPTWAQYCFYSSPRSRAFNSAGAMRLPCFSRCCFSVVALLLPYFTLMLLCYYPVLPCFSRCCPPVIALFYHAVTLLLTYCYPAVFLLLDYCYPAVTLLLPCYYPTLTLMLPCFYPVVTLYPAVIMLLLCY
jgi:hypothetical protein